MYFLKIFIHDYYICRFFLVFAYFETFFGPTNSGSCFVDLVNLSCIGIRIKNVIHVFSKLGLLDVKS